MKQLIKNILGTVTVIVGAVTMIVLLPLLIIKWWVEENEERFSYWPWESEFWR